MARVRLKRRQTNTLMNAKLHPEYDADLIAWWAGQPMGKGSAELKAAAREHIAKGTDAAPATQGDVARLTVQMEQIVRLLAQMNQRIERGVVVQGAAIPQTEDETARLSADEAQRRANKIKQRNW